jgi:hypothetical protein
VATAVTLAVSPVACFFTGDAGPGGPGGTGAWTSSGPGGTGGGGHGGSKGGSDQCNPVTNAGCPTDGSTCDFNGSSFVCFPPPNSVDVCGSCDTTNGPFCGAGLSCVELPGEQGSCYRYCCTDADCGSGATCDTGYASMVLQGESSADNVGFCIVKGGPSCAAVSAAPSNGSCVGGYTGGGHHPDGGTSTTGTTTGSTSTGTTTTGSTSSGGTGGGETDGGGTGGGMSSPDGGHAGRPDGGWGG